MSGTVLSRIQEPFGHSSALTNLQKQTDELVGRFISEATNPITLASISAGSLAYRMGRIGVMGSGWFRQALPIQRSLSVAFGLGAEVSAFELTNRTLVAMTEGAVLKPAAPSQNLWSWSGVGGWKEGLISSLITFGALKGAGFLAREENLVFQHFFQSTSLVAGNKVLSALKIGSNPEGSLAEQFLHAEVINLQLAAGMGLLGSLAPRLQAHERSLDLHWTSLSGLGPRLNNLSQPLQNQSFSPSPVLLGPQGRWNLSEVRKGPTILQMSAPEDKSGGAEPSLSPSFAASSSPRLLLSLAVALGVEVPTEEFQSSLSRSTDLAFRNKVMGLISAPKIRSRLSSIHLMALRTYVAGGELLEAELTAPLLELIRMGREEEIVEGPNDSRPTLPPPEPLQNLIPKDMKPHEVILGTGPHIPGRPHLVDFNLYLPDLGEVSVFSETRETQEKSPNAFGIGGNGVFMLAETKAGDMGEIAGAVAVESVVVGQMQGGNRHLGHAFLEADAKIRALRVGAEVWAAALHVKNNGTLEAAAAGGVEIWILFWDGKSSYGVVPYLTTRDYEAKASLGSEMYPQPRLVQKENPAEAGEIIYASVPFPRASINDDPFQPLELREGDGFLMMSSSLARYYHEKPPYQLLDLVQGKTSAAEIRKAIQEDSLARQNTLQWRRGLKFEGVGVSTLVRSKILEGMPMAGDYIDSVGDVYDSETGGNLIANFGEEGNRTALVYLHRSVSIPVSEKKEVEPPPNLLEESFEDLLPLPPPAPSTPSPEESLEGLPPKDLPTEISFDDILEASSPPEDPLDGLFDFEDKIPLTLPQGSSPERTAKERKPLPGKNWEDAPFVRGQVRFESLEEPTSETNEVVADSLAKLGEFFDGLKHYKMQIRYPVVKVEDFILDYGKNFKRGGVFLRSEPHLPSGSLVNLEFMLKNGELIFRARGQVDWIRKLAGASPSLPPGVGIRFLEIDPAGHEILKKILSNRK